MTPKPKTQPAAGGAPSILVVDDDRRVRELLEIALSAHGFGVLTAADGDEAIKRALGQRPDLVVLDVRLPKKSGLEVCDILRGDPDDPSVPIILVSAAVETDARLQAFARGADDYMAKPFSPKELIARIKRLLARDAESRAAVKRAKELERELTRTRDEARRAEGVARREQSLRELASGVGRDLLRTFDRDTLAQKILQAAQARLGVGAVTLLVRERPGRMLLPCAARGDDPIRAALLALSAEGEMARVLAGLGRPVRRGELERLPELRPELAPFVAAGAATLVPLVAERGLEALMVLGERRDGLELRHADLELLSGLCEMATVAIENSQRIHAQLDGWLEQLAVRAHNGTTSLRAEAAALVARAARECLLPPRERDMLRRAVLLGPWASSPEGRSNLGPLVACDPTGGIEHMARVLERVIDPASHAAACGPEERRAELLLRVALDYVEERAKGAGIDAALAASLERSAAGLDLLARQALAVAASQANDPRNSAG